MRLLASLVMGIALAMPADAQNTIVFTHFESDKFHPRMQGNRHPVAVTKESVHFHGDIVHFHQYKVGRYFGDDAGRFLALPAGLWSANTEGDCTTGVAKLLEVKSLLGASEGRVLSEVAGQTYSMAPELRAAVCRGEWTSERPWPRIRMMGTARDGNPLVMALRDDEPEDNSDHSPSMQAAIRSANQYPWPDLSSFYASAAAYERVRIGYWYIYRLERFGAQRPFLLAINPKPMEAGSVRREDRSYFVNMYVNLNPEVANSTERWRGALWVRCGGSVWSWEPGRWPLRSEARFEVPAMLRSNDFTRWLQGTVCHDSYHDAEFTFGIANVTEKMNLAGWER